MLAQFRGGKLKQDLHGNSPRSAHVIPPAATSDGGKSTMLRSFLKIDSQFMWLFYWCRSPAYERAGLRNFAGTELAKHQICQKDDDRND